MRPRKARLLAGLVALALIIAAPASAEDDALPDETLLVLADMVIAHELFFSRCGEITGEVEAFAESFEEWHSRNAETIALIWRVLEHQGVDYDPEARREAVSPEVELSLQHGETVESFCSYYSMTVFQGLSDYPQRMPAEYARLIATAEALGY